MKYARPTVAAIAILAALLVPGMAEALATGESKAGAIDIATGPENADHIYNENSTKCLAVPGGSKQWGAGLIQWSCDPRAADHWWYLEASNLYRTYRIRNRGTDQCMGLPHRSTVWGQQVIQWPCGSLAGAPDHYWELKGPYPSGYYQLVNHHSRLCLAVRNGSYADGAAVIQWPCSAYKDHFWISPIFA